MNEAKLNPAEFLARALQREETVVMAPPGWQVRVPSMPGPRRLRLLGRREAVPVPNQPHQLVTIVPHQVADRLKQGGTMLLVHVPDETARELAQPSPIVQQDKRLVAPDGRVVSGGE